MAGCRLDCGERYRRNCTYRFRWKADIDGITYEGDGRGTTVLKKEDTQWKIVHEHLSRFSK